MNAKTSSAGASSLWLLPVLLLGVLVAPGCMEDESHVQELRRLREKLAEAEKLVAAAAQKSTAAAAAPATVSSPEAPDSAQKLAAAELRIAALEKELQESRKATSDGSGSAVAVGNADNFKEFVKAMERDLLVKTGELQQAVEQAAPTLNIQETTVKRLRLPEQMASAFNSAVVFSVPDLAAGMRKLEFPVQAGLDGQWRMPGVADVQQHITTSTARTPTLTAAPHAQALMPASVGTNASPPDGSNSQAGGSATVVINWDKAAASTQTPTSPPPTSAAAVKPPAAAPAVPKSIMPVQESVQIRFE